MELYENFSDNNPFICVRLLTTSSGYVTKEIHCSHGNSSNANSSSLDCAVAPATAPQPNRNGTDNCVSCEWVKK